MRMPFGHFGVFGSAFGQNSMQYATACSFGVFWHVVVFFGVFWLPRWIQCTHARQDVSVSDALWENVEVGEFEKWNGNAGPEPGTLKRLGKRQRHC